MFLGTFIITSSTHWASASPPKQSARPQTLKKQFIRFKVGDTLYSILRRHGFKETHIAHVLKSNPLPEGLSLFHGESYRLKTSSQGKYAEVKIYNPLHNRSVRIFRDQSKAGVEEREETFEIRHRKVSGRIYGSLLGSIMAKLPNKWVAHRFMDAFLIKYHRLPSQLQRGAPFDFVVETKWENGDLIGYGQIVEASIEVGGQREQRHFVEYSGGGAFIDPVNLRLDRPLYSPVDYMRISSLYNPRRLHPIKRRRQPHLGVDFELPEGEPVYASAGGTVLRSGRQRGAGNFVVILHANGLESYYNHLLKINPGIHPGARVGDGQQIGQIGCTGWCTKAHLHFSVKKNGRHVDPLTVLRSYPYRSHEQVVRTASERLKMSQQTTL